MRIFDAYFADSDALDGVRTVAKLKDVSGETLDREVFIQRAHERFRWFENHAVIRSVGYGAAVGDG